LNSSLCRHLILKLIWKEIFNFLWGVGKSSSNFSVYSSPEIITSTTSNSTFLSSRIYFAGKISFIRPWAHRKLHSRFPAFKHFLLKVNYYNCLPLIFLRKLISLWTKMELAVRFKQVVKSFLLVLIRGILCVCISMTKYNFFCCGWTNSQVSLLTDVRTVPFANPNKQQTNPNLESKLLASDISWITGTN
jgi:hypothetical protein